MFPLIKSTKQLKLESDEFNNELQTSHKIANTKFGLLANETKISELETKIITLEQGNQFLAEQIRSNERNFEIQLKRLGQQTDMEKDNRQKIERFVGMLTDQVSINMCLECFLRSFKV